MRKIFPEGNIVLSFLLCAVVALPSSAYGIQGNSDVPVLVTDGPAKTTEAVILTKNRDISPKKEKEEATAAGYYKKGRRFYLLFSSSGYKKAIEFFDKALKTDKNYVRAMAGKAEAQALLSRVTYNENDDEIITTLEMEAFENAYIAAELEPDKVETHRALSLVYFIQKKYAEGKKEAQKAIELDENDAESYLALWLNSPDLKILRNDSYNTANYFKALDTDSEVLDKIVELAPDLPLTYLMLGAAYSNQNNYFDALRALKKVIKLTPENEEAYAFLGSLYNKTVFLNDAITQFNLALKIEPERYDAIYGLGVVYLKKRDRTKAKEYFEKACNYDYIDSCDLLSSGFGISKIPGRTGRHRRRDY
jgi:tetratricopeptide (TPR) repeat protein